jgi:hypothetical protein
MHVATSAPQIESNLRSRTYSCSVLQNIRLHPSLHVRLLESLHLLRSTGEDGGGHTRPDPTPHGEASTQAKDHPTLPRLVQS